MDRHLDFFLFLWSTYTYLALNRAERLAAQEGIALHWRPFSVRSLMIEQNNRSFVGKPVKLAYMWRDLERDAIDWCKSPDEGSSKRAEAADGRDCRFD